MKRIILVIVVMGCVMFYACRSVKPYSNNVHIPANYLCYDAIYSDSVFRFIDFEFGEKQLTESDKKIKAVVLDRLDSLKILNHQCDTIYEIWFWDGGMKHFACVKTSVGTMSIKYSKGVPNYGILHATERLDYHFNGLPRNLFEEKVSANPDSVLVTSIYNWDIKTISEFFSFGLAKYYPIEAWRYVLKNDSVYDVQNLYVSNSPYGWDLIQ